MDLDNEIAGSTGAIGDHGKIQQPLDGLSPVMQVFEGNLGVALFAG